jgi:hypothetical protein
MTSAPSTPGTHAVALLASSARIEFDGGAIHLHRDHLADTLAVTPEGWGSDPGPHPTNVIWDRSPLFGLNPDNENRPMFDFPNALIEFLKDRPEFAPVWMKNARGVAFYEATPPEPTVYPRVRVLTFRSGKPEIEIWPDRDFGQYDLIATFECMPNMGYELFGSE